MSAALRYLLWHGTVGRARHLGRRMRSPRGALTYGALFLFLGAFAGVQLWVLWTRDLTRLAAAPGELRAALPPVLLLLTVLALITGRGLHFTPAEVDLLFPAPIPRRQLLLYHLATRSGVQVASGLWVALFVVRLAPRPATATAAVVLFFVFTHLASQAVGLASLAVEQYLPRALRRLFVPALIAALVLSVAPAVAAAPDTGAKIAAALGAPVVRALSLPVRPFAEAFASPSLASALLWLAASAGVMAALVGVVLVADVAYADRALAASHRAAERLARLKTAGFYGQHAPVKLRLPVPALRFLGPAGPFARRQLLEMGRSPRTLAPALLGASFWMVMLSLAARGDGETGLVVGATVIAIALPFFVGTYVPFDFRRDLDRMAALRALPVPAWAVAVGQVLPVVAFLVALQYLMILVLALAAGVPPSAWALGVLLVIPPLTWTTTSVENALFLLMPYRVVPGSANVQFLGKSLASMLLKLLALGALGLVAGLAAWGAWKLAASPLLAWAAAAAVLALGCIPLTFAVGAAFTAFDLSRDVPA